MTTELLFSYGTLRLAEVQRSTFGRELDGRPDAIVGYDLDYVTITDPDVVAVSGSDRHPILRPSVAVTVIGLSAQRRSLIPAEASSAARSTSDIS